MEASATPAGQIIIRIEADEVPKLRSALRNAAMTCEAFSQNNAPMLEPSVTAEQSAEWMEQLGDAIEDAIPQT